MPPYPGTAGSQQQGAGIQPSQVPTCVDPGDSIYLWGTVPAANAGGSDAGVKGEQPAVGTASIAAYIAGANAMASPPAISIEVSFFATGTLNPSAPGSFEIDIQEADTDADAFYAVPTVAENPDGTTAYKITSVSATTQKARVDLSPQGGKFIRALLVSRGNAVDMVVKLTQSS